MPCANFQRTLLALTLITAFVFTSTASAQTSWRVYDLRDLIGLLPPPMRIEAAGPMMSTIIPSDAEPMAQRPDSVYELMDRLCQSLQLIHVALSPGIYGIEAGEAEHTTLLSMLDKVRELYVERYEVQILWYSTSSAQAPAIGDPVTPAEPLHRQRFVVARRTPTELVQVSQFAYVSNIQPVIATNAVGYAYEVSRVESGLRASIIVGAGSETETATSIQVTGNLRHVAMGKMSGTLTTDQARSMEVELP